MKETLKGNTTNESNTVINKFNILSGVTQLYSTAVNYLHN